MDSLNTCYNKVDVCESVYNVLHIPLAHIRLRFVCKHRLRLAQKISSNEQIQFIKHSADCIHIVFADIRFTKFALSSLQMHAANALE